MIRNLFCVEPKAERTKQINDSLTIEVFPIEHFDTVKIMFQRRLLTSGRNRKGPERHIGCTMKRVIDTYIHTCIQDRKEINVQLGIGPETSRL